MYKLRQVLVVVVWCMFATCFKLKSDIFSSRTMLFAEINPETNVVLRVIVCESKEWCEQHLGGVWVQTHDDLTGKNFASIGYKYHELEDNFSPPQPYPSWTLDTDFKWQPPVPYPDNGGFYSWKEDTQEWVAEQM